MSAFAIYVKSLLDYCNYVWNPVLCRDIDAIENVLRAYASWVLRKCGLPRMSYSERLIFLNMPGLEQRFRIFTLCVMFPCSSKFTIILFAVTC